MHSCFLFLYFIYIFLEFIISLLGSDCPVSLKHSKCYSVWLDALMEIVDENKFTLEAKKKLFGENAKKVYRFL
jgi:predicted TIM-barrel fold metal-dependent hydrolase